MQEEGENLKKILETEIILEKPQGDIPNL